MGGLALNKSLTDYCANFTYSMWVDLVGWVKKFKSNGANLLSMPPPSMRPS